MGVLRVILRCMYAPVFALVALRLRPRCCVAGVRVAANVRRRVRVFLVVCNPAVFDVSTGSQPAGSTTGLHVDEPGSHPGVVYGAAVCLPVTGTMHCRRGSVFRSTGATVRTRR